MPGFSTRRRRLSAAAAVFFVGSIAVLTPSPALAAEDTSATNSRPVWYDDQHNRHELLFDARVWGISVRAACPTDYPYLHGATQNTKLPAVRGVALADDSWDVVWTEYPAKRGYVTVDAGTFVNAISFDVLALFNKKARASIEMVCTKEPAEAWRA